ncbi:MAG: hypothetical protein QOG67_3103 [Verrucomicrobiota bacterium]|jgi:hypothetical protein
MEIGESAMEGLVTRDLVGTLVERSLSVATRVN